MRFALGRLAQRPRLAALAMLAVSLLLAACNSPGGSSGY
ncbi:MAG: hypothetical protein QOJ75_1587 [Chloroflexota bacterium]|nr:hypothetical protein [Chloroflexota bacterium]